MMPPYYARKVGWSSQLLLCALLALQLGAGCSSGLPESGASPPAKIHPKILELNKRAVAAERRREHHEARSRYQQAIDESPDPASAAFANRKMASALLFWQEDQAALLLLRKSLEHDPTQVPVWHDLGILEANLGHDQEAREALEQAVALAPREPRTRLALASILVRMTDYRQAHTHYKVLLTLKIPPRIEEATHKALRLLESEIKLQQK